jgi:hypothetical protein
MTLNKRADTAAAAMVNRMMIRSRPLVFLLVLPRRKGSRGVGAAMTAREEGESGQWEEWKRTKLRSGCQCEMAALSGVAAYVSSTRTLELKFPRELLQRLPSQHIRSASHDEEDILRS